MRRKTTSYSLSEADAAPAPQAPNAGAPARSAGFTLAVLVSVYAVNYVDRQILSILIPSIQRDLGFSDTEIGFLSGIAFSLFYATFGVPLAMLADRTNRVRLITATLALFSLMTAVCGMVANFWQMALARVAVAIGEAGTIPASSSIVADVFSKERRGAAMAVLTLGVNLGLLIALPLGGWLDETVGWRWAFVIVGVAGLFLAVAVLIFLREPPRRSEKEGLGQNKIGFREGMRRLRALPSFWYLTIGSALYTVAGYGSLIWLPSFFSRSHEMGTGEIGLALAATIGVGGGLGAVLIGYLSDWLGARRTSWRILIVAIAAVVVVPFSVVLMTASSKWVALAALIIPAAIGGAYLGPALAVINSLVNDRMRAFSVAVFLMITNLIGPGIGPQYIGILSDILAPEYGRESLRYAMLSSVVVYLVSAAVLARAAFLLPKDMEKEAA